MLIDAEMINNWFNMLVLATANFLADADAIVNIVKLGK